MSSISANMPLVRALSMSSARFSRNCRAGNTKKCARSISMHAPTVGMGAMRGWRARAWRDVNHNRSEWELMLLSGSSCYCRRAHMCRAARSELGLLAMLW